MNVLMVSAYYPPHSQGGGEISAHLLAKALSEKINIQVLTSGDGKTEEYEGVKVHRRLKTGKHAKSTIENFKRMVFFEKSLLKETKKFLDKVDIVHCMNSDTIPVVQLGKAKYVMHVNSPVPFCPKGTLMYKDEHVCERKCTRTTYADCFLHSQRLGKMQLTPPLKYNPAVMVAVRTRFENNQKHMKAYDHFTPISTYMQSRLEFMGLKNSTVIYNITEYEDFLKLSIPKNSPKKILYLGSYAETKGPQVLMDALNLLDEPYEANFYGDGPLREHLEKQAKGPITVHDAVPYKNIPGILGQHDILVVPSLVAEAFGRSAVEGCAAGKTVIASDIGGLPDIIKQGKTGYLFKPGNAEELSSYLKKAISSPLSAKKVRKHITEKFSKQKTVDDMLAVYKSLL